MTARRGFPDSMALKFSIHLGGPWLKSVVSPMVLDAVQRTQNEAEILLQYNKVSVCLIPPKYQLLLRLRVFPKIGK